MMWARIDSEGLVVEKVDVDPAGRFHPALVFAPCAEDTPIGYQYSGGVFIPYVEDAAAVLAKAQSLKVIEIEAARDAACFADVTAHAKQWQADSRSQELLWKSITLAQAGLPLPPVWRATDNSSMAIASLVDLLAIVGAIALQAQSAYERSWLLKAQVADAQTVQQVEDIQW